MDGISNGAFARAIEARAFSSSISLGFGFAGSYELTGSALADPARDPRLADLTLEQCETLAFVAGCAAAKSVRHGVTFQSPHSPIILLGR